MKKKILIDSNEFEVEIGEWTENEIQFELNGERYRFGLKENALIDRGKKRFFFSTTVLPEGHKQVFVEELEAKVELPPKARKASAIQGGAGSLQSPMPGKIFKVLKGEGEEVKAGDPILILEAMKMEHTIKARQDGVVKKIHFEEGAQVQGGVELCEIE